MLIFKNVTCEYLRKELKRRKLLCTGKKDILLKRLNEALAAEKTPPPSPPLAPDGNNNDSSTSAAVSREEKLREKYGSMTLEQLKALLKDKKKKHDLIERLVYYDINSNFVVGFVDEEPPLQDVLEVPELQLFKDIHAGSPLPPFTRQDLELYLNRFQKSIAKGDTLYQNGYLKYARFCCHGEFTYIHGECAAEMKKQTNYIVDAKLAPDGEIEGCNCECTHGKSSGEAHCKHVCVLLLAVAQMKSEGVMVTELTCTQQLQTFHKPKQKFRGTPLKAFHLSAAHARGNIPAEEEDESVHQVLAYRAWFRNVIINGSFGSTMPVKHLFQPANPYAFVNDHSYSKFSTEHQILDHFHLREITPEKIYEIEECTRGQSSNKVWHDLRETHITASKFYEVTRDVNPKSRAAAILHPSKFSSRATAHGLKYESTAIKKYKDKFPARIVKSSGLVVMETHPYIAGSPDFLVDEDGLGEVKCPYTTRNFEVGPQYQPYLKWSKKDKRRMKLSKNHQYYYQVQGLMMVTGRQFCDFVVFSFKGFQVIRVWRNETFISLLLFKLVDFFIDYQGLNLVS